MILSVSQLKNDIEILDKIRLAVRCQSILSVMNSAVFAIVPLKQASHIKFTGDIRW